MIMAKQADKLDEVPMHWLTPNLKIYITTDYKIDEKIREEGKKTAATSILLSYQLLES